MIRTLLILIVIAGSSAAAEKKRTGPRKRLTKVEIYKMRWMRAIVAREKKAERRRQRGRPEIANGKVLGRAFADFNRRRKAEAKKIVKNAHPNELWTPGFSMKRSNR